MTTCTTDLIDIWIDEQTSLAITINTLTPVGEPRDLTGASNITWVAAFMGKQKVKKDLKTMLLMLSPQSTTYFTSGITANTLGPATLNQITGFGNDAYGRPKSSISVGDTLRLTSVNGPTELAKIATLNPNTKVVTFTDPVANTYGTGATNPVTKAISSFEFSLLPGDTILPATKSYRTPVIWEHMALATWPSAFSPGNINQEPTTVVVARGRMFIIPILDTG